MNYPLEILPNENFTYISCDLSEYHLIRNTPYKPILFTQELFPPEFLKSDALPDFSTSLFGIFDANHSKIKLIRDEGTKIYGNYCEPNVSIIPPTFKIHFEYDETKYCYILNVFDFHEKEIKIEFNNQIFEAVYHVVHTPMQWNFWHFSIRCYIKSINSYWHQIGDDNKDKKKIDKLLSTDFKSLIKQKFKTKMPLKKDLPKTHYFKDGLL